jgi:hypothetical protein
VAASRPRVLNSVGVVVAVRGVAQQGRGWPHRIDSDGDGAPAGLTSRFDPAGSHVEGSRVRPAPLRGRGALAVLKWAAQCRGADTGLVAQSPTVAGMGSPLGVGGTAPGRDSQARSGAALPCQSIKCPYTRAGAGALVREPRARRSLLGGGVSPRAGRSPLEGGGKPSSEADLARGGALLGRSGRPREPPRRGLCRVCMFYVRFEVGFVFCIFLPVLSRIPPVF